MLMWWVRAGAIPPRVRFFNDAEEYYVRLADLLRSAKQQVRGRVLSCVDNVMTIRPMPRTGRTMSGWRVRMGSYTVPLRVRYGT